MHDTTIAEEKSSLWIQKAQVRALSCFLFPLALTGSAMFASLASLSPITALQKIKCVTKLAYLQISTLEPRLCQDNAWFRMTDGEFDSVSFFVLFAFCKYTGNLHTLQPSFSVCSDLRNHSVTSGIFARSQESVLWKSLSFCEKIEVNQFRKTSRRFRCLFCSAFCRYLFFTCFAMWAISW